MTRSRPALGLALAAALVSGIAVYVNGLAVRRFPSATVYTTGKNLIAGALLVTVAVLARRWSERRTPSPTVPSGAGPELAQHRLGLVAVAVIGGAVPFLLFFEGLSRASSTDAAFIHKTLVVWVAVLAAVLLRERVGAIQVVAIGLLVLGHASLVGGVGALRLGTGEVMILVATLCWAVELIVVKRLLADLPPTTIGTVRLAGGSALLVAWVVLTGDAADLTRLSVAQWSWLALTGPILATFVIVWFTALSRARVVDVTAVLVLGAVVTGLIDAVFGDGRLAGRMPGDGLIVAGVILVLAATSRRSRSSGEPRALQWT